jgi:two-component system, NtrC family, response regulator HydG
MEEALLVKVALSKAFPDVPITVAQDGDLGLKYIQERTYALAVIDLNLPGTDGIEVIKAAGVSQPEMPTIAVTGYSNPAYLDGAYRAGASAVLTKPLDLPEFTRVATDLVKIEKPVKQSAGPTVLAVGARAGDVEAGCGGILLKHSDQGHNVLVAIAGESGPSATAATSVASLYGAKVIFHPSPAAAVNPSDTARWIEELVAQEGPLILYVPSEKDRDPNRFATHQAALSGGKAIPKVLAYQSPGSTIEFSPKLFVDIGTFLERKLALVNGFAGFGLENLEPATVGATARYWGRFAGPAEVEPLEVLRG